MLTDKHGFPVSPTRMKEIRDRMIRMPSARESGTPCAARRTVAENFISSTGRGYCAYCGLPQAMHT